MWDPFLMPVIANDTYADRVQAGTLAGRQDSTPAPAPDKTHSLITKVLTGSKTWDPPNIAADGSVTNTTVTVTGAAVGDMAVANLSTLTQANAVLDAKVTAADTVTVVLFNKTGGALDVASGTLKVLVLRA